MRVCNSIILFTDSVVPPIKIKSEFDINITGQLILTQMLVPILSTADKTWIINTTSALGVFPKNDALVNSASKGAMRNFISGLRFALKPTRIKVMGYIHHYPSDFIIPCYIFKLIVLISALNFVFINRFIFKNG